MDAQAERSLLRVHRSTRPFIANSELRSILSNLSLELCRPLISLRTGFDLLLADPDRPISHEQREHVQTMVVLCDALLFLTRDSLDHAPLVQGTRPLCLGIFTIGTLIREIDRQSSTTAASQGIGWECRLDGADASVTTDATRCQQIFGNLVANALNYTPKRGKVSVRGRIDGSDWVVTVEDDGPGIAAEHLDRVFEPFYRISPDDHSLVEGNGLGLAIARELVDQLTGQIELQSEPGQGTRVVVRLPIEPSLRSR